MINSEIKQQVSFFPRSQVASALHMTRQEILVLNRLLEAVVERSHARLSFREQGMLEAFSVLGKISGLTEETVKDMAEK